MNAYRFNGKLDRQYLRITAVYRLLAAGKIGSDTAVDLLAERNVQKPGRLVGFWLASIVAQAA